MTYWLRFSLPFALLVIATWIFMASARESQREVGQIMFYMLTGGLTIYAFTAGLRSTADCLSEEKREGTLGLLFLTDLRGYDVVLGKLLANSLSVFYGVLAVLPILAIPLLLGGVAGAEFGRLALVLVNTLFFSLSAGMLASALCQNARVAIATALGLILLAAAGGPALGLLEWKLRDWQGQYEIGFSVPSPVYSYIAGVDVMFKRGLGKGFWWSVGCVHGYGWLCLGLASWIVRNKWQDKPATVRGLRWRGRVQGMVEGAAATQLSFRTRLLNRNAFFWLAARPRSRMFWGWLPLGLAAGVWAWGYHKLGEDWFNPGIYATTAFLLSVAMKALIGSEAGRRLLEDRKIGAMELLLATPLSVREILHGQALALYRQFGGPVVVMLLADFVLLVAGLNQSQLSLPERPYWLWVGLAGMVMFVADAIALYWMGLWLALAVKNPRHAFGAALAPILTLPWVAVALVMTGISLLPYEMRRDLRGDYWVWGMWFGFSLLADFGFGYYARKKLLTEFREVAAQRFQTKRTWWQRLTGKSAGPQFT